ncbi:hypothetical protein AK830_g5356 [Neonectria ditissima]|uniref:SWIM-type domain-containing protein n=1 Tax=Neonectria ditissima TaxID=78410 RepID=A0A0P7BLD3_9HYPO|nr:hypothetical protein AK830_g5356 [Neonectria ditissima]
MASLPSHRQLLTTLINSVSDIALTTNGASSSSPPPPPSSSSPLQAIAHADRPLLLTLHVLFPNLLLPALDLLDRKLVTRLRQGEDRAADVGTNHGIFLVRSLAVTLTTRRTREPAPSTQRYIVHLDTWNCSCASFTFDAYPNHPGPADDAAPQPREPGTEWSFGGVSRDGQGASSGDVPCCKHILACLLFTKWPRMLDRYVEDRSISRDEMAGILAEM